MNNPYKEIKRWGIVVIQSLYPNDTKTGESLYNDILRYKNIVKRDPFLPFMMFNQFKISVLQLRLLGNHYRTEIFLPCKLKLMAVTKVL